MGKYKVPPLPYGYDALEPHIDEETARIHHTAHQTAYADGLNEVLSSINALTHKNYITGILSDLASVPEAARDAINFFGGGYDNHRMFWESMRPGGGGGPGGRLADEIGVYFGSFTEFKRKFESVAAAVRGSGWGWLVYNPTYARLEVMETQDETSPWTLRRVPLLGIDVWEHAYYLRYENRREEYIGSWWHTVNWGEVEERYLRVAE